MGGGVDNSAEPGLCKTELTRESKSFAFRILLALLARTAENGSRNLIHCAVATEGENFKGEYITSCAVDKYSSLGWMVEINGRVGPFVLSEQGKKIQLKLWNEMMEILGKVAPEINTLF